jgi:hypothetical protein
MNDLDLNALLAVLLGLMIRFGVPLFLTGLAAWGLRRLDHHWQLQAEHTRPAPLGLGAAPAEVRCWETTDCPPEKRQACAAFAQPDVPCWQVFRQQTGMLMKSCLSCEVFVHAPVRG